MQTKTYEVGTVEIVKGDKLIYKCICDQVDVCESYIDGKEFLKIVGSIIGDVVTLGMVMEYESVTELNNTLVINIGE